MVSATGDRDLREPTCLDREGELAWAHSPQAATRERAISANGLRCSDASGGWTAGRTETFIHRFDVHRPLDDMAVVGLLRGLTVGV